jgi:hypothetical protein
MKITEEGRTRAMSKNFAEKMRKFVEAKQTELSDEAGSALLVILIALTLAGHQFEPDEEIPVPIGELIPFIDENLQEINSIAGRARTHIKQQNN